MTKKNLHITVIAVFVLAFLAGSLVQPKYFNQGVDFLNSKFSLGLPHFWEKPLRMGLDLQGGTHLVYEADLSSVEEEDHSSTMAGLRDIIERRVNLFGVQEPLVQVQEKKPYYRLIVELAGVKDVNKAIEMIGETPFLEFKEQRTEEETQKILDKIEEIKSLTIEDAQEVENWELAFEDPYFKSTDLNGKYLKKAGLELDQTTYQPVILLEFNDQGSELFKEITAENIGKQVAIYIDDVLVSAPVVQEEISGGRAQITGQFTVEEAKKIARNLNAGALPVPVKLISQQTVGPALGAESLEKSLKAVGIGFLTIILFLALFYRLPGILAALALAIYALLLLALFKLIPVTLTLAGIGGAILSMGMAVDANILIFSRVKEELEQEKSFGVSLEQGFQRAWPSIKDSNFTTLIIAFILFAFGTSFVKGFALTLSLGILISMFSAIFITQNFLRCFEGTKLENIKWLWK
ncbi:protein translocase subunit SecD [Candidatus Parcubacteria bacterium]|nr:protein translocase subunit SecD [Candidatus Parcubacteria bacterium]